jgi:hypothetical protein
LILAHGRKRRLPGLFGKDKGRREVRQAAAILVARKFETAKRPRRAEASAINE